MSRLHRQLMRVLVADIVAGAVPAGSMLPREADLAQEFGVSRGVAREAIRGLEERGLVAVKHGRGATVSADERWDLFNRDVLAAILDSPRGAEFLREYLECRRILEIEAAGLAAERAQPAQIEAMAAALEAIDRAIGRDELAVMEDFAFHRAVADATGNPQFPRFLEFLGRYIIPRQSVRVEASSVRSYLVTIQAEHRAIFEAIRARSVDSARRAMRRHLLRSRDRYRRLAAGSITAG
jgi:GntR family transcriptional regulator, transcriptional repressor for pyruvate dehydrogenase complex